MWWWKTPVTSTTTYVKIRELLSHLTTQHVDLIEQNRALHNSIQDSYNTSSRVFIDVDEDGSDCIICLQRLLGPCVEFACDCKCMLHESCLIKFIAAGHVSCPACRLDVFNKCRYKELGVRAHGPPYNEDAIDELLKKLLDKKISAVTNVRLELDRLTDTRGVT